MLHCVDVRISGRVQGVGFRYFTKDAAESSDAVTGWVRNDMRDGVEIYAEGTRLELEKFLLHVKQGPPMSRIDDFHAAWREIKDRTRDGFNIET